MALLPTDEPSIELTLEAATSITPPSLPRSVLPSFPPPSVALSLSSFNLSITGKKSRLRTTEGGRDGLVTSSGVKEGRANPRGASEAVASSLPSPSSRSWHAACSELSVAQCGAEDLKGMRSAVQVQESAKMAARRKGRMEGVNNFRHRNGGRTLHLHGAQLISRDRLQ